MRVSGGEERWGGVVEPSPSYSGTPSPSAMSGYRGGRPMATSSSSARNSTAAEAAPLPLIDCPQCGIPLIKLRSKKQKTYGMIFYKCPNNFENDETCGFYWWEGEYVEYLRARELKKQRTEEKKMLEEVEEDAELRQQVLEVRQQIVEMNSQMQQMKYQMGEMKQMCQEKCQEKFQEKKTCSTVAVLCLGIVLGMLATLMWK